MEGPSLLAAGRRAREAPGSRGMGYDLIYGNERGTGHHPNGGRFGLLLIVAHSTDQGGWMNTDRVLFLAETEANKLRQRQGPASLAYVQRDREWVATLLDRMAEIIKQQRRDNGETE